MGEVSERGFSEAMLRLHAWVETGDYRNPVPFAEALQHLYILENSHRHRLGDANYFAQRAADVNGAIVGGIIYARGLNSHSDVYVAVVEGARPFTFGRSTFGGGDTFGGQGIALVWPTLAALPAPGIPERNGRDAMYQQRVENRPVLETFEDARTFFDGIEGRA